MITAIEIENFKGIRDRVRIELKPITLIFGANSAGKSSIVHSLLLAHEANRTGSLKIDRTLLGGESVRLGGFAQFAHRQAQDLKTPWSPFTSWHTGPVKLGVEVCGGSAHEQLNGVVVSVEFYWARIQRFTIRRVDGTVVLDACLRKRAGRRKVTLEDSSELGLVEINWPRGSLPKTRSATSARNQASKNQKQLSSWLRKHFILAGDEFPPSNITPAKPLTSLPKAARDLVVAVNDLLHRVAMEFRKEMGKVRYLGPLREILGVYAPIVPFEVLGLGGHDLVRSLMDANPSALRATNRWLGDQGLGTQYEVVPERLVSFRDLQELVVQELREDPSFAYMSSQEVVESLEIKLDVLESRAWEQGEFAGQPGTIRLLDKARNAFVDFRNVGLGLSQVLPVVVSSITLNGNLIAIEQPELHLHPAMQARLGDLFIEGALGKARNRFILETHSEHLILRVMRRMRETYDNRLPQGALPVTPSDVAVIYVENVDGRTIAREMPLNERGELVKAWPGGFFEEGLNETMA